MGSYLGVQKVAAERIGLSLADYLSYIENGLKWCNSCRMWKSRNTFGQDTHRGDGLDAKCLDCRHVKVHKQHMKYEANARTKTAAANAVKYAIVKGKLSPPTELPCFRCGTTAEVYHHHLGYARQYWLDVRAVCKSCHSFIHWNGEPH